MASNNSSHNLSAEILRNAAESCSDELHYTVAAHAPAQNRAQAEHARGKAPIYQAEDTSVIRAAEAYSDEEKYEAAVSASAQFKLVSGLTQPHSPLSTLSQDLSGLNKTDTLIPNYDVNATIPTTNRYSLNQPYLPPSPPFLKATKETTGEIQTL